MLPCPAPQVLVLVGTDRLDRPLTIGQMQGKFQPVLLPQVREEARASRCLRDGAGRGRASPAAMQHSVAAWLVHWACSSALRSALCSVPCWPQQPRGPQGRAHAELRLSLGCVSAACWE